MTFAGDEGEPLEYLHPVETIAVNGLHAVVISKAMLRADMLRKGRTYELLITRHWLSFVTDGRKPRLECEIVFRGIHGRLELDLTAKDKAQAGRVVPTFYSLSGEESAIPDKFLGLVRAATRGANCRGCLTCTICANRVRSARRNSTIWPDTKLLTAKFRRL